MSLRGPPEVFAREVRPRLLAAPAELILDALPPLQPQMRFLEVGAGGAVVARPLLERIAGLGRLVAIDDDVDLACALPNAPKRAARAVAGFPQLPFAADVFDVAIANLVLGEVSKDGPRLAELRRVLPRLAHRHGLSGAEVEDLVEVVVLLVFIQFTIY